MLIRPRRMQGGPEPGSIGISGSFAVGFRGNMTGPQGSNLFRLSQPNSVGGLPSAFLHIPPRVPSRHCLLHHLLPSSCSALVLCPGSIKKVAALLQGSLNTHRARSNPAGAAMPWPSKGRFKACGFHKGWGKLLSHLPEIYQSSATGNSL